MSYQEEYELYKQEAALRLFKGYIVKERDLETVVTDYDNGLIIEGKFITEFEQKIQKLIIKLYSKEGKTLNQTFHKSFEKVKNEPIGKLIAEQLIHYFTTYGFDALGIYDKDLVYVPREELNVPELNEDIGFIVIHNFSEDDIREKMISILSSGIALSKESLEYMKALSDYIPQNFIHNIKNKEFRLYLYDKYQIVPKDPDMFLRYILYRITDSTQTIFNEYVLNDNSYKPSGIRCKKVNTRLLIDSVYEKDKIQSYFERYIGNYASNDLALKSLAPYFNRYKTFFMTLKASFKEQNTITKMCSWINKIGKYSKKCEKVCNSKHIDYIYQANYPKDEITQELEGVTVFRELRLLNYMKREIQRQQDHKTERSLYRIRNGKVFTAPYMNYYKKQKLSLDKKIEFYNLVYEHLVTRLSKKLKNKSIYIPDGLELVVPTSEKQFLGEIPNKSYVSIPRGEDIVVGVHWYNLPKNRVDLDLHMVNKSRQFGWNSNYRSDGKDIVYSGDMTDAILPNGAGEYFLVESTTNLDSFLLTLNNFSGEYDKNGELDYEFIIAKRKSNRDFCGDYCVDPNDVIFKINKKMYKTDGRQVCLGLLDVSDTEIRFYFSDFDMGYNNITHRGQETAAIYQALKEDLEYNLDLKSILKDSGMILLDVPYKEELREVELDSSNGKRTLYEKIQVKPDYDLSPNSITKLTLIDMLND